MREITENNFQVLESTAQARNYYKKNLFHVLWENGFYHIEVSISYSNEWLHIFIIFVGKSDKNMALFLADPQAARNKLNSAENCNTISLSVHASVKKCKNLTTLNVWRHLYDRVEERLC